MESLEQPKGIHLSYREASGGSFSDTFSFLHLIYPVPWGLRGSEVIICPGLMTWLVALAGVFLGRDRRKKFWLLVLLVFPLLMLGPGGGLHPLLSFLLPVTRFMRHSSQYVLFVFFAILYFFVLGANWLLEQRKVSVKWNWVAATATVFTLLGVYAFKWDPRTYVWVAPALVSCFIFA